MVINIANREEEKHLSGVLEWDEQKCGEPSSGPSISKTGRRSRSAIGPEAN